MRFRFIRRKWAKINNPEFKRREVFTLVAVAFAIGAVVGQCGEADLAPAGQDTIIEEGSRPPKLTGIEIIE